MRKTGLLLLLVAPWAGCPLAHDDYDTGRSCVTNAQCPESELCLQPDAAVVDGRIVPASSQCYEKTSVRKCTFGDGGVSYFCFVSSYRCYHIPRTCLEYDWDGGCPTGCRDDAGNTWDAGCVKWQPEQYGCEPPGGTQ